jgi:hemerythrin superfamily protein
MNALELLTREHREQENLLDELAEARHKDIRLSLYEKFREALIKHISMEEKIFYPRLKKIPGLEDRVLEALEEHNICMQLLQELDASAADKIWKAKMKVLKELTEHHVKDEENNLFPEVRELASEEYLQDMGQQMKHHKKTVDPEKVLYPDENH